MSGRSLSKSDMKANARFVAVLLVIAILTVIVRLADIQILNADKYKRSANSAQWDVEMIPARRGSIYDAEGSIIAQSAQTWQLYLIPENFESENFRSDVCKHVADTLGLDYDELIEQTRINKSVADDELVIAHKKVVKSQMELSEKRLIDCGESGEYITDSDGKSVPNPNPNCLIHRFYKDPETGKTYYYSNVMGLDKDSKRYYPMGDFCSGAVGFINADGDGASGIERYYNTLLSGTDGRKVSYGSNVRADSSDIDEVKNGVNLKLTISEAVQLDLDKNLKEVYERSGGLGAYGIVMDVNTGAILAMDAIGYKGNYDLSDPDKLNGYYSVALDRAVSNEDYDELDYYLGKVENGEEQMNEITSVEDYESRMKLFRKKLAYFYKLEQWNNYCVSETYHPGSVFKIFLTAAALEENILPADYTYTCVGSVSVEDRIFNCHVSGHGTQDLRHGLMNSCNPFFIKLGLTLGAEKFFKYFEAFGFTEKTGIESIEESNSIYYKRDELTRVSLASESFGQTFSITPIQLITAISSIANGGKLMQPYIVAEQLDDNGNVVSKTKPTVKRQVISEETAATVASMMEDVVKSGTGKNGYVAGYRVAGKTGTTQKYQLKGTYIASFGCFAPADDPQIAVLIIVDEPQGEINGSTVCAPVAAKVVENTLERLGVERQYTDEEIEKLDTNTPGVIGRDAYEAGDELEEAGFEVRIIGGGSKVISQSPAGGQTIPKGGVIALYTTDEEEERVKVTVPDLSGLGVSGVKKYAASEGINVRTSGNSGSGVVSYDQSIAAGTQVEYGTIVTVYFKSYENISDG
ncbi:MAG: PASTA domain-containing protein [Clostridia bacterium]|nr:PASTA domain-containing protein [Clostridia bacterium]